MYFMKTLDKVPHHRLIAKLHSYGIHIIRWTGSFVTDRKQRTMVNCEKSWNDIISAIPQESVLGLTDT